jgi:hypothetical protein
MQIVRGAIITGPVVFLVIIAVFFVQQGRTLVATGTPGIVTIMALAFLMMLVPLSFVVPALMLRSSFASIAGGTWKPPQGNPTFDTSKKKLTDADKLMMSRQTADILAMAMLEGTTFLACIGLFLEAHVAALAVAVVVLLLMVARFPTEGRIRAWLSEQTERLEQLRRENFYDGPGVP